MTLHYRDRERLLVSFLLSTLLFALLFLLLNRIVVLPDSPFPEVATLLLTEVESDIPPLQPVPETEKVPVPPAPVPLVGEADKKESVPTPPSPAPTPMASMPKQQAVLPPAKATAEPRREAPAREGTVKQAVPAPNQPSPYTPRGERAEPLPPRIQPFNPPVDAKDPETAEREFLQAEKTRLESWLRDNAPQAAIPATGQQPTPASESPVASEDPALKRVIEQLSSIQRRLEQLQGSSTRTDSRDRSPSNQTGTVTIFDRDGRELGKGDLKGRVPLFPLNIGRILPEDFEGFPIQNLELRAEFLINEGGLLEPGSLKVLGDSRYTRIVEKVRLALEKWRFDARPGVRTPATIYFVIKVRSM